MKKKKLSVFEIFNLFLLWGFCLLVLLPFLHVVSLSFSSPESSFAQIRFWPEKFTWQNYIQVFRNKYIYSGNLHEIYGNILPLPALDIVNEKQNYWDFSTGFMIYVPWERHYREFMHNFIGFSVNHFTRPKDNFIEENARIPIKLSLQWNSFIRTSLYSLDKKSSLYVCPGLLYENRGDRLLSPSSFDNFIVGSDITTDPLFGGVWYSSQLLNSDKENYKAIIFKLGLKFNSANKKFEYRLAYSYDMSLGNLVKSTEGSHEISFNITYRFNAKYRYNIFSF